MLIWIRRFARIAGCFAFFAVFFAGIDPGDPLNVDIAFMALAKGFAAAALFWIAGYIAGDIVFKGVVEAVDPVLDDPLEGGMVQWLREEKERMSPETIALEAQKKDAEGAAATRKG